MTRLGPILLIAIAAGCATTTTEKTSIGSPGPEKVTALAQAQPTPPPAIRLIPLNARVVGGREEFRFVIIDFTNSRRPRLDERLNVYRVGQKVGEVKISGPFYQDTTVAADLLAGEAKYGDEVKVD